MLFQCFLALLLNNWQFRKHRIFKALASTKGPFQREVEVIKFVVAFPYNLEE